MKDSQGQHFEKQAKVPSIQSKLRHQSLPFLRRMTNNRKNGVCLQLHSLMPKQPLCGHTAVKDSWCQHFEKQAKVPSIQSKLRHQSLPFLRQMTKNGKDGVCLQQHGLMPKQPLRGHTAMKDRHSHHFEKSSKSTINSIQR